MSPRTLIRNFSNVRDNSGFVASELKCKLDTASMCLYVAFAALLLVELVASAPPLRMTIDCGSDEDPAQISRSRSGELLRSNSRYDVNSFCNLIQRAIPQAVKDGQFIIEPDLDLDGQSDTVAPVAIAPPSSFIPKLLPKIKPPRLTMPVLNVPKLKPSLHSSLRAPKIGSPMPFRRLPKLRYEEESSVERMEKFKKGVQNMLHFVKVLGRIDQYISERTRIVVDKLSKTFAE